MIALEWVFGKYMYASLLGLELGIELLVYRVNVYLDLLHTNNIPKWLYQFIQLLLFSLGLCNSLLLLRECKAAL